MKVKQGRVDTTLAGVAAETRGTRVRSMRRPVAAPVSDRAPLAAVPRAVRTAIARAAKDGAGDTRNATGVARSRASVGSGTPAAPPTRPAIGVWMTTPTAVVAARPERAPRPATTAPSAGTGARPAPAKAASGSPASPVPAPGKAAGAKVPQERVGGPIARGTLPSKAPSRSPATASAGASIAGGKRAQMTMPAKVSGPNTELRKSSAGRKAGSVACIRASRPATPAEAPNIVKAATKAGPKPAATAPGRLVGKAATMRPAKGRPDDRGTAKKKPAMASAAPAAGETPVATSGTRTTSTTSTTSTIKPASRRAAPAAAPARDVRKAARPATRGFTRGKRPAPPQVPLPREVAIKALDPLRKCGPNTTVQHMFRVDESLGGAHAATHLVFFDRHGWYCVHGRTCQAVEDVRKLGSMRHVDLDYNGRMRA